MTIQSYAESKASYIINEYEKGRSSTDISKELKINSYYVCKILNTNNVTLRNTNKMSSEEVNLLMPKMKELFESGKSVYQIAKEIGTDNVTTGRRLKKMGCNTGDKSTERKDKLVNHTDEIIEMYKSGLSTCEITKKFQCGNSAVWKLLEKNGTECRDSNKYSANYDYFNKIDSDESSYLLGLLYADGHVKTKAQVWGIQLIDESLVKEIANRVKYTGKIHFKKPAIRFKNNLCKAGYELLISSPKMKADLIKLGCVPQKTFILKYPTIEQVPLEFRSSFIRGYCDGDGSIGYSLSKNDKSPRFSVQFTGTKEICDGIMNEILSRELCNTNVHVYKANSKNNKNTYYCVISGESCVKFLDWIYQGSTIHLERKWRKYMQLKEYFQYKHLLITPSGNKKGWKTRQKPVYNSEP